MQNLDNMPAAAVLFLMFLHPMLAGELSIASTAGVIYYDRESVCSCTTASGDRCVCFRATIFDSDDQEELVLDYTLMKESTHFEPNSLLEAWDAQEAQFQVPVLQHEEEKEKHDDEERNVNDKLT